MNSWFIDTIDPLGGSAFTSLRGLNTDTRCGSLVEVATYFVGPPQFRAEPVAGLPIGLAASRGTFQEGLFVGGQEVPFAQLSDVVEFVRRVYVRGGGGGFGPGPAPIPPGPSPAPEGGGEDRGAPSENDGSVLGTIEAFAEASKLLVLGAPAQHSGFSNSASQLSNTSRSGSLLVAGGQDILLETLRRFPLEGERRDIARWLECSSQVGRILDGTGVLAILAADARRNPLFDMLSTIATYSKSKPEWRSLQRVLAGPWIARDRVAPEPFLYWLLGATPAPGAWGFDPHEFWMAMHGDFYPWFLLAATPRTQIDPFETLFYAPAPRQVMERANSANDNERSLGELLALVLAHPQSALNGTPTRVIGLCMLASAHLIVPERPRSFVFPVEATDRPFPTVEALDSLAADAVCWLLSNLPDRVFSPGLEDVVASANHIRT